MLRHHTFIQRKTYKIIVVGNSNVGKTCLLYRFCEGKTLTLPEATVGVDLRKRTLKVGGEELQLHIWDTAGLEKFRHSMVANFYRNAHAVIVVYDVTDLSTLQSVPEWLDECEKYDPTGSLLRILVGNKCDCGEAKVVKTNFAKRIADSYNMQFFETSALGEGEEENIEGIFQSLAEKLVNRKPLMHAIPMPWPQPPPDTTSWCGC